MFDKPRDTKSILIDDVALECNLKDCSELEAMITITNEALYIFAMYSFTLENQSHKNSVSRMDKINYFECMIWRSTSSGETINIRVHKTSYFFKFTTNISFKTLPG